MVSPTFVDELARAAVRAARRARERAGRKQLYAFALYTSGESDFGYVCASANTEQALSRTIASSSAGGSSPAERMRALRFSAPDWALHDFDRDVREIALPPRRGRKRDAQVYEAFVTALRRVDRERVFGTGKRRESMTLAILCGDMSDAFLLRGIERVNPVRVTKRYVEQSTPKLFLARLRRLPARTRTSTLVELWEDLALARDSTLVRAAQLAGANQDDVEELVKGEREASVEPVLQLLERHVAAAPAWNRRGSPEWHRVGVASAALSLASSAAFLLADLRRHVPDTAIPRLQACIRRRRAIDARSKMPVPTLAENIARAMHTVWPKRFPQTRMHARTNRLMNPAPFLLGGPA